MSNHLSICLAAARSLFGDADLWLDGSVFRSRDLEGNVCQIGELHVGVDDDEGSYQILDNNGDGLVELTFFRKG